MSATTADQPAVAPETLIDRTAVVAIFVFAGIAALTLLAAPVIAVQLGAQFSLTPSNIGLFFTTELGAMSLATIPSYWWLTRVECRLAARIGIAVMVIGNLLACLAHAFPLLLAARFVAGLGEGSLMILCMTSAGMAPNKDRVFGIWVVGQLLLGALGLVVLPPLFARFGLAALFVIVAAIMLAATPLAGALPRRIRPHATAGSAPARLGGRVLPALGILAVLAFYISLGGVWTFIGRIAGDAGIAAGTSAQILSVATLFGIAGALAAAFVGNRSQRWAMVTLGCGVMIVALAMLLGGPTLLRFSVAAYAFKCAWTFVLPFILASVSQLDRSGRLMTTVNMTIGAGLAIGPGIAGAIIQATGGFQQMLIAALATLILAFVLILPAARAGRA